MASCFWSKHTHTRYYGLVDVGLVVLAAGRDLTRVFANKQVHQGSDSWCCTESARASSSELTKPCIEAKTHLGFPECAKSDEQLQAGVAVMCFERTVGEERMHQNEGYLTGIVGETALENGGDAAKRGGSHARLSCISGK